MTPARLRRSLAMISVASVLSLALAAGSGGAALASSERPGGYARPTTGPLPVLDHGGPVMLHSHTVAIFWGPAAEWETGLKPAMKSLLAGMNGSAYLGVAQQYMRVTRVISSSFSGALYDTSPAPKTALQPKGLAAEVAKLVATPKPDTIYFVFTSTQPNISYCAYHSAATANGVLVQVAYVPRQPSFCSATAAVNLHANGYSESVQASADSTAHEFMEAVTDPHLDAWFDKNGAEVSDKCAYDYQGIVHLANATTWQIQSTWSNASMSCDPGLGS